MLLVVTYSQYVCLSQAATIYVHLFQEWLCVQGQCAFDPSHLIHSPLKLDTALHCCGCSL